VELLWFSDCPNHVAARRMLEEAIAEVAPGTPIQDVDATDPVAAERVRFPGSPTIRVDGQDIDPTFVDPGDYTPRCRLYRTDDGLRGLPERSWIVNALTVPAPETQRALRGHPIGEPMTIQFVRGDDLQEIQVARVSDLPS
jgi:hypothetical protein